MIRRIIQIDEDKCDGCGICANACHEGAIEIINDKAKLTREDYCDGLGDCLPNCPHGAITFIEKDAPEYDHEAVLENQRKKAHEKANIDRKEQSTGCPGSRMQMFERNNDEDEAEFESRPHHGGPHKGGRPHGKPHRGGGRSERPGDRKRFEEGGCMDHFEPPHPSSQLRQWPCQIKLVPINAPYYENAKLLIAADCTAYAYAAMHPDFMRGHVTLIGCPKLDGVDYSEKLTEIIKNNDIKEVTVVRMEVPCCRGIENAVITALKNSGKFIPWQRVVISTDGKIKD